MRNNVKKQLGRPRRYRRIDFKHKSNFFKPQGVPMSTLNILNINKEELEVLRLKDLEELDQNECAKKMNTSQSTFQRILSSARKKVSKALVEGLAIKIED